MNRIETFIRDISSDENEPLFLPITNTDSIELVNHTLHENDYDYLEGAISLTVDSEVILSKSMETTDLLFTWQTLIEPILAPNEKDYRIALLDSLYEVELSLVNDGYVFARKKLDESCEVISKVVPKKVYNELVKDGFLEFGEYIINNQLFFSEESSFLSFVEDYKKIRKEFE
ncbi:hypothetical protein [Bacillus sp. FJAT-47783]|uniref:hypothetical protein n=1 Tax=Bacillus sp. FJAT-47783 TaxID=2922712 RepID=UPI001FACBC87|nr:hypothetical protein [Bacillus sp. FJAT-47783]